MPSKDSFTVPNSLLSLDSNVATAAPGAEDMVLVSNGTIKAVRIPISVHYCWANRPNHTDLQYEFGTPFFFYSGGVRAAMGTRQNNTAMTLFVTRYKGGHRSNGTTIETMTSINVEE